MNFRIKSEIEYNETYEQSVQNFEHFWGEISTHFWWKEKWHSVQNCNMQKASFQWYIGGKTNICYNAVDRHLKEKGKNIAYIFEPNNPAEETVSISYNNLHDEVCRYANLLKQFHVKKGDRVCIYLPMIPELVYAVLACARIGAVHSVVFAGFSSQSLAARIQDCEAKVIITADGGFRGAKSVSLKSIADEALVNCPSVEYSFIVRRTNENIKLGKKDVDIREILPKLPTTCEITWVDAEEPLFILYTSGSTGKPKGMLHTTGGYMVYTGYTFKNVFAYESGDIYWCTADIGWITGHSYIVYGPLLNGATSILFEGIPTFPDAGRFWEVIQKYRVTQFYTAPTAIRSLARESLDFVTKHDLSSLKIIGSVGEPINEEAWQWYNENIGKNHCPIVDTWWQTETGGILISPLPHITKLIPTYATKPLPGIQPVLMDEHKKEILEINASGNLCLKSAWPSIARTIYGDHQRYIDTYFSAYPGYYFTGDGAYRDESGNYRITGRVDDVIIVSGHNLGTAPIEDAINEHPLVAESAIVGFPHDIKGNALYGFVTLRTNEKVDDHRIRLEINQHISNAIGPIAKLDKIQFTSGLPKTRSGKIMRRILRKIAEGDFSNFGDISTLLNPEIVEEIKNGKQ
jgi:acetyl-CoA synthetase